MLISLFCIAWPASLDVFWYHPILLDPALTVDYTVDSTPQYEVIREDHPNDH